MLTKEKVEAIVVGKKNEVVNIDGRKNEIRMWEEERQRDKRAKRKEGQY